MIRMLIITITYSGTVFDSTLET
uniref:Uncharacterized protein n=1 Tax=Rhizophora mucronata TaxID=61149 RepID=A0A2P2PGV0_RHIMU